MNTPKQHLIVGCLVLVAFLWGYKGDSMQLAIAELITSATTRISGSGSSTVSPSANPTSPPTGITAPQRPVTPDPFGNAYKSVAGGRAEVNPEAPAAGRPAATPAASPFAGNMAALQQGKINEGQATQRNAYFDKLSEQMKQLRSSQTIPDPVPRPKPVENNDPQPSPMAPRQPNGRPVSPAVEVPGMTGSHPEFTTDDADEEDDSDEELDDLEEELSDLDSDDVDEP